MLIKQFTPKGDKFYVNAFSGKVFVPKYESPLKKRPNAFLQNVMADNSKLSLSSQRKGKMQVIMSEPSKVFVEEYLTKRGEKLANSLAIGKIDMKDINNRYKKNRYKKNPNAKPLKTIKHFV